MPDPNTDTPASDQQEAEIIAALLPRLENKALHYLARYPSSAANLKQVLARFVTRKVLRRQKFADYKAAQPSESEWQRVVAAAIDALIQRYVELGYVNDADYAKNRIRVLRERGTSQQRIIATLYAKGVDRTLISEALATSHAEAATHIGTHDTTHHQHVTELAAARRYAARRRLGCYASTTSRAKPDWEKKHLASMLRAGFPYRVAKQALWEAESEDS